MKKNEKEIVFFMPSIESGGVEKNLFIIGNFIAKNIKYTKSQIISINPVGLSNIMDKDIYTNKTV